MRKCNKAIRTVPGMYIVTAQLTLVLLVQSISSISSILLVQLKLVQTEKKNRKNDNDVEKKGENQALTRHHTPLVEVQTGAMYFNGNLTLSTYFKRTNPFDFAMYFKKFILQITYVHKNTYINVHKDTQGFFITAMSLIAKDYK